ncbi:hypothetical protein HanXRQr2_Chr10g0427691 [Helianthus annuus]|uniref:Uncharacterized protein n=1 Tax=Helianthus annuus TaxID=4232 RepID=A0A9K3HVZ9_HELAN|nr:hypothetical protein HanXRQr2_Chr10g0427691 [Helianthus annuus]
MHKVFPVLKKKAAFAGKSYRRGQGSRLLWIRNRSKAVALS